MLVTTIATSRQTTNSGSLTPVSADRFLERVADQDHHVEHEKRAQKPDVADIVDRLVVRIVGQADDRIRRRRSAELVTAR